jgi:DNA-binding response OmpR family regulator
MSSSSGKHILLVDDDPGLRTLLRLELEEAGYRVQAFASAEAALAEELRPPALAVLDFRLPGIDGLELLRRLREAYPGLPALIVTSEPGAVHPFRRSDDPVTRLLGKPFRRDRFLELVGSCTLASHR